MPNTNRRRAIRERAHILRELRARVAPGRPVALVVERAAFAHAVVDQGLEIGFGDGVEAGTGDQGGSGRKARIDPSHWCDVRGFPAILAIKALSANNN